MEGPPPDRDTPDRATPAPPEPPPAAALPPELDAALRALVRRALQREVTRIDAVEAGLGRRRFARVHFAPPRETGGTAGGRIASAIARIDAPEDPRSRPAGVAPEPPLEPIRAALEAAGLPVPARHASDPQHGIELLEDLGDDSLARLWPDLDETARRRWIERALLLVPQLQRVERPDPAAPPVAAFDRRLDRTLFDYKAAQLIEHGLPFARQRPTTPAESEVVRAAFASVAREAAAAPQRLAHRDFKAANLHRPPGSADRFVMIDLQGAFLAPPEYDLVCLLRDLQIEVPDAWLPALLARVRALLPDAPSPKILEQRFTLLTLTRVGKDFSRFALTWQERADARYARPLPRAARMLESAAERARSLAAEFERFADLLAGWSEAPGLRELDALGAAPGTTKAPPCAR